MHQGPYIFNIFFIINIFITSGKNVEVNLVESNGIEAKAQVEKSNGDTI